jgi:cytidine deaminase
MKKKKIHIEYFHFENTNNLDASTLELIEAARNAMKKAYAPYSSFQVGAALRLDDNSIIEGNNQENAAYPSGLCAERVALFYAGAQFPSTKIKEIAIIASSLKDAGFAEIVTPCGSCRQVMLETQSRQNLNMRIVLVSTEGKGIILEKVDDLIPFSFNLKSLLSSNS